MHIGLTHESPTAPVPTTSPPQDVWRGAIERHSNRVTSLCVYGPEPYATAPRGEEASPPSDPTQRLRVLSHVRVQVLRRHRRPYGLQVLPEAEVGRRAGLRVGRVPVVGDQRARDGIEAVGSLGEGPARQGEALLVPREGLPAAAVPVGHLGHLVHRQTAEPDRVRPLDELDLPRVVRVVQVARRVAAAEDVGEEPAVE